MAEMKRICAGGAGDWRYPVGSTGGPRSAESMLCNRSQHESSQFHVIIAQVIFHFGYLTVRCFVAILLFSLLSF